MSATNRGALRRSKDFYSTPKYSFTPLLPYIPKVNVWEPASGDNRLINWMLDFGIRASGSDIQYGYNFLTDFTRRECIITNPPFTFAERFIEHSNSLSDDIFLLLRLNFLGAKSRFNFWSKHEPNALFILSRRPSFTDDGLRDATEYAWFYWGKRYSGIRHLI